MDSQVRVLLVDDEEAFPHIVRRYLEGQNGYVVDTATGGREAIQRAIARGGAYDVAVIDQRMRPPNGTETMIELKRRYPQIEVIMPTGFSLDQGEEAIRLGAHRYMRKPDGDLDELALNIRTAARYGQERRRRLVREALVRVGGHLGDAESLQALYARIEDEVAQFLPALDVFSIAVWDALNGYIVYPYCRALGEPRAIQSRPGTRGLTGLVITTQKPMLFPDGSSDYRREHDLGTTDLVSGTRSEMIVPMFRGDVVSGTLHCTTYDTTARYDEEHLAILQSLANQADLAIVTVTQRIEAEQLKEAVTRLATCAGHSVGEIEQAIVREAHVLIDADLTDLAMLTSDGDIRLAALFPEMGYDRALVTPREDGLTRQILRSCRRRVIPDTRTEPGLHPSIEEHGFLSIVGMPLTHQGEPMGVLYANSKTLSHFEAHHLDLWESYAAQAAAILHAAMEREQQQAKLTRRLEAVVHIFERAQQGINDTVGLLEGVVGAIARVLETDFCAILTYDQDGGQWDARYAVRSTGDGSYGPVDISDANPFPLWTPLLVLQRPYLELDELGRLDGADLPDALYHPNAQHLATTTTVTDTERIGELLPPIGVSLGCLGIHLLRSHERVLGLLLLGCSAEHKVCDSACREHPDRGADIDLLVRLAERIALQIRLQRDLKRADDQIQARVALDILTLAEDTWRHSLKQWASSIQWDAASLATLAERVDSQHGALLVQASERIARNAERILSEPIRVAQAIESDQETIPLAPLLREMAEHRQRTYGAQGNKAIRVAADVQALHDVQVRASRVWLHNGLDLLIENAREALAQAAPEQGTIAIQGRRAGRWAEVRVVDDGPGIPEALRDVLYNRLVPEALRRQGRGLGSELARRIVTACGGTIGVEATGPEGTTILVRLPIAAHRRTMP